MFRNNLIIAWRNIKRSKVYSALNVLGLAVGMAGFVLIILLVRYEISYDRYHEKARDIFRVVREQPGKDYPGSKLFAVTPAGLAPAMARDIPEVLAATRIGVSSNVLLDVGEKSVVAGRIHWADPQTFEIFSFPLVRGDRATALKDPFSLLLSERESRRLFGGSDPIGRTVLYKTPARAFEFRVDGVFRDIPANSHFVMDFVAPFETFANFDHRDHFYAWGNTSFYTYVLLKGAVDLRSLERKLSGIIDKHVEKDRVDPEGHNLRYSLQPLNRIHLHSRAQYEIAPTGDIRLIVVLVSIAVLVLVMACVNYMNLAAARSFKRAKEVSLRKVVGASHGQLVRQFLGDSMMTTFIALVLAMGVVAAVLPAFRVFAERDIVFDPLRDLALILGLVLLSAAVGMVAGSYPAFFASSFRPVSGLKSTGFSKAKGRGLRSGLTVFQFTASVALLICTVGVWSQLRFIRSKDMGYERNQILVLSTRGGVRANIEAFKTELRRHAAVINVAASTRLPNNITSRTAPSWLQKPGSPETFMHLVFVDYDYLDVFGLRVAQGRGFSREFPSDARGAYLINESARNMLGWADPVGREFGEREADHLPLGKIVGIVKDFHLLPLHLPIVPLFIVLDPAMANSYVSLKIRGSAIPSTLAFVRETWERFELRYPFDYSFFDDIFDRAYRVERRLGTMFSVFAGLAVLIACLGLLGLAAFTAEQKTKEIGIRKVLGASTAGVIALLSRDFLKWVVAANVIAWPIGYFAMRSWLGNFAYRIDLTVPMFLGAALAAFLIAAAVIGLQTYRAAAANPANSMRYE